METLSLSNRMVIEVSRSRACVSASMNGDTTYLTLQIPNFRKSSNARGEHLQHTASCLVDVDTGHQVVYCAQQADVTRFVAERSGHVACKFGSGQLKDKRSLSVLQRSGGRVDNGTVKID